MQPLHAWASRTSRIREEYPAAEMQEYLGINTGWQKDIDADILG